MVFSDKSVWDGEFGVERIEEPGPHCVKGCAAIMHRHDSGKM